MLQYLLCIIIGICRFRFVQSKVSKVSQTEMGEIKPKKPKTNCANGNIIVLIHIFKLTQMKTSYVLWCLVHLGSIIYINCKGNYKNKYFTKHRWNYNCI